LPLLLLKTGNRLMFFFSPPTACHGSQMLYDGPSRVRLK
jgi:hypothetical protein